MDNFDLKKYLAEGKLYENKEPTIRAKEFWQDADYIQSLKDDNYSDVAEWILNNWIGNMSASEFLKSWDGFIKVTGTEGGDSDVLESMLELEKIKKQICSVNLTDSNPSLNLAKWITGTPMIYYPFGLQSASIRFKNSLQENCKMHAFSEDVMEACHNGIVAWEKKSNVQPILIEGQDDHIKTKERWQIFKKFLEENKIEYKEIISVEGSIISKIMNLIYLLDYSTIYKSVLLNIDPSPVKSIDFVKSKLI